MWAVMESGVGPRAGEEAGTLVGVPEAWPEVWVQDSKRPTADGCGREGRLSVGWCGWIETFPVVVVWCGVVWCVQK